MSIFVPQKILPSLPFLYPCLRPFYPRTARRYASSARRTTKKLRTKPDRSFTANIAPENLNDHIVFNPPSSSSSPYQTPPAFLPKEDPRRALLAKSYQHANPYLDSSHRLPPLARGYQKEKKYHLTPGDMDEIRKLRAEDPMTWNRKRLAERFGCSQFFVGMIAEASKERKQNELAKIEAIKDSWGKKRRQARADRSRRRELWSIDK